MGLVRIYLVWEAAAEFELTNNDDTFNSQNEFFSWQDVLSRREDEDDALKVEMYEMT